jgi:hypothetical protein
MNLAAGMTMQWYVRIINWNEPGNKGNHMNSRSISFLYAYFVFGWKAWDMSCSKLALNSGSGTFWGKTWCVLATVEQVHEQWAAWSILPQLAGLLPLDKLFTVQDPCCQIQEQSGCIRFDMCMSVTIPLSFVSLATRSCNELNNTNSVWSVPFGKVWTWSRCILKLFAFIDICLNPLLSTCYLSCHCFALSE